jgi:hypothetical protein
MQNFRAQACTVTPTNTVPARLVRPKAPSHLYQRDGEGQPIRRGCPVLLGAKRGGGVVAVHSKLTLRKSRIVSHRVGGCAARAAGFVRLRFHVQLASLWLENERSHRHGRRRNSNSTSTGTAGTSRLKTGFAPTRTDTGERQMYGRLNATFCVAVFYRMSLLRSPPRQKAPLDVHGNCGKEALPASRRIAYLSPKIVRYRTPGRLERDINGC